MKQRKLRQWYLQRMRAEQKKTFLKFAIFPTQKRDRLAPVFIEPELAMKSGPAFITGKQEAPESVLSERLTIWTLLLSAPTGIRNCIIVGAPGSGKTTLLQHTAALLARGRDMHHRRIPDMLPVFLSLPACAALIESRADFSLGDAVCEQIQKQWQQTAPKQWMEELIAAGQCVILLDGLDAVADQLMRNRVTLWVQQQMHTYPQNRFIVTVRSWSECATLLDQTVVLEICPFNMEQIEQYTQQWFRANMVGYRWRKVQKGRQHYAQEFLQKLHAMPSLRELASNPLHLMLLTLVYHRRQRLPIQRGELYAEIVRIFHDQIIRLAGTPECTISQIQNALAFLAWSMLQEGKEGFSLNVAQSLLAPYLAQRAPSLQAGDFLNMSSICGDVFLGQEKQGYRFTHRAIQEYLAATYAKEQHLEQVLANQIGNSWWHETIHSFCIQADATSLLQSCLEYPGMPTSILTLIGQCLEDGLPFEPSLRERSESVVEEHLEDPDPVKQHIAAELWLRKRTRTMIALGEGISIDRSLVIGAEYQLFLDAQRLHGRFCQPDHWKTLSASEGQKREAVLGVRASDAQAFCQWLTKQDKEGWRYRLPVLDEWNQLEGSDDRFVVNLPSPGGCWIGTESDIVWKGRKPPTLNMTSSTMQTFLTRDWSYQPADPADFARPLRLAYSMTRLLACDVERGLAQHLMLACERLQGCDPEQSFALAQTWAALLQQTQILAVAHSSDLQRALVGDISGARTADERARMFTHVRNLVNLLYSAGDVSHDLLPMLRQALDRGERSTTSLSEQGSEGDLQFDDRKTLLLASLRSCTLHLACFLCKLGNLLFSEDVMGWFQHYLRGKDYADLDKEAFERTIAGYLDLYLTLVILELRRQNQIPAWEGILLIKERSA